MSDQDEGSETRTGAAGKLIAELRRGSSPVDVGQFRIDPRAAVEKLKEFRYLDVDEYLVHLAEGLHALGATVLDVRAVPADLFILATEARIPEPGIELTRLYGHVLDGRHGAAQRALARIAIGIDMALSADSVHRVVVIQDDADRGVSTVAEFEEGQSPRVFTRPCAEPTGCRMLIDRTWRSAFTAPDRALVHFGDAVRHSAHDVRLDGTRISGRGRGWDYQQADEDPEFRYRAGFEPHGVAESMIEVWSNGVRVDEFGINGVGFRAVLEVVDARRDLSQSHVIRGEAFRRALESISVARRRALLALEEDAARWTDGDRPSRWPAARVAQVLGVELETAALAPRKATALRSLPSLHGLSETRRLVLALAAIPPLVLTAAFVGYGPVWISLTALALCGVLGNLMADALEQVTAHQLGAMAVWGLLALMWQALLAPI